MLLQSIQRDVLRIGVCYCVFQETTFCEQLGFSVQCDIEYIQPWVHILWSDFDQLDDGSIIK